MAGADNTVLSSLSDTHTLTLSCQVSHISGKLETVADLFGFCLFALEEDLKSWRSETSLNSSSQPITFKCWMNWTTYWWNLMAFYWILCDEMSLKPSIMSLVCPHGGSRNKRRPLSRYGEFICKLFHINYINFHNPISDLYPFTTCFQVAELRTELEGEWLKWDDPSWTSYVMWCLYKKTWWDVSNMDVQHERHQIKMTLRHNWTPAAPTRSVCTDIRGAAPSDARL